MQAIYSLQGIQVQNREINSPVTSIKKKENVKDRRKSKQRMQNSYLVTTSRTLVTFIREFLKTVLIRGELNCLLPTLPLPCLPPMLPF